MKISSLAFCCLLGSFAFAKISELPKGGVDVTKTKVVDGKLVEDFDSRGCPQILFHLGETDRKVTVTDEYVTLERTHTTEYGTKLVIEE